MPLLAMRASSYVPANGVLPAARRFQMVGVYAASVFTANARTRKVSIVANMVDLLALGNRAFVKFIRQSVGASAPTVAGGLWVKLDDAVSVLVQAAREKPAAIGVYFVLGQKPVLHWPRSVFPHVSSMAQQLEAC